MRFKWKFVAPFAGLVLALQVTSHAAEFNIDPNHSSVSFRIKHVIGKVTGHFNKFSGTFDYGAGNPNTWRSMASINAARINTGIEKRDNHLRSTDFIDVQKFSTL